MTETKTIRLDETDLKRILTEKFKTDENSISFKLIDPDGYGIHIETKIENVREKGDCMEKAILIMDMPERCNNCYAAYMSTTGEFICRASREKIPPKPRKRPDWCPLRELPEKKELYLSINNEKGYCVGFNDCLDDILGETNGKEKL